jgi:hypothetical protein
VAAAHALIAPGTACLAPSCYSMPMSALSPSSTVENPSPSEGPSVGVRVGVSAAAGALSTLVVAVLGPWWLIPLSGWDMAALVFVIWMWRSLWSLDAAGTASGSSMNVGPVTS